MQGPVDGVAGTSWMVAKVRPSWRVSDDDVATTPEERYRQRHMRPRTLEMVCTGPPVWVRLRGVVHTLSVHDTGRLELETVRWSGKTDSNRRPFAGEANALPLELLPLGGGVALDSLHRPLPDSTPLKPRTPGSRQGRKTRIGAASGHRGAVPKGGSPSAPCGAPTVTRPDRPRARLAGVAVPVPCAAREVCVSGPVCTRGSRTGRGRS